MYNHTYLSKSQSSYASKKLNRFHDNMKFILNTAIRENILFKLFWEGNQDSQRKGNNVYGNRDS